MAKTILITGATDGIGRLAAQQLVAQGHHVLIHGRSEAKLAALLEELAALPGDGRVTSYRADLSDFAEVEALAQQVSDQHAQLDVLINNAGVFVLADPATRDGLDARFVVNTIAPYLLTQRLLPRVPADGRVVNLSSAAQAPVDVEALAAAPRLSDNSAYAQSKLAITMWTRSLADSLGERGPMVVAVNPGSMLATKMVQQAYGVEGADLRIGADILCRAALADDFAEASGQYFDNDSGRFAPPHPDALDARKRDEVVRAIEALLAGR